MSLQPTTLDDICAAVGYTATRTLLAWYEGKWLYVPASYSPKHPLSRLVGEHALKSLVGEFGGEMVRIPTDNRDRNLRRNRDIAEDLCRGVPLQDLALKHDLTPRRIEQLRSDLVAWGWIEWAATANWRGASNNRAKSPHPAAASDTAVPA
jgi:hypothetical protein